MLCLWARRCNQLVRRVSAALLSLAALAPPAGSYYQPIVPPAATSATSATPASASSDPNASAVHLWEPPLPLRRRVAALRAALLPRAPALLRRPPPTSSLSPRSPRMSSPLHAAASAAATASDGTAADAAAAAAALCDTRDQHVGATEGASEGLW